MFYSLDSQLLIPHQYLNSKRESKSETILKTVGADMIRPLKRSFSCTFGYAALGRMISAPTVFLVRFVFTFRFVFKYLLGKQY